MRTSCLSRAAAAALLTTLVPGAALATNGYFTHGTSIKEKALAGAGVAWSQDTLSAANNPAGMVFNADRYDAGVALFSPHRGYEAEGIAAPAGTPLGSIPCTPLQDCPFSIGNGDQSIDSENEAFFIPQFGYNQALSENATLGVSIYGNGGMNTEYKGGVATLADPGSGTMVEAPGTLGDGTTGVDLAQLFIAPTYSRKFNEHSAWGVSLILAYQRFAAKGLRNFGPFSSDPAKLTNNGHDSATGIGIRLGVQGELMPGLRAGAAYQPEIDMSEFDDYSGLFAEQGDFDIPSTATVGVAWDVEDGHTVVLDVQWINYEDVPAVANSIDPLIDGSCAPGAGPGFSGVGDGCLGGDDGAGFGWENITIVKLGYQWRQSERWTWRFGYSKTDQPIPDSEVTFNVLAPGVIEEHFTAGFTHILQDGAELNFAAMFAPSHSVSGTNTFDPAQEIELEMDQYELAIGYSRRFD